MAGVGTGVGSSVGAGVSAGTGVSVAVGAVCWLVMSGVPRRLEQPCDRSTIITMISTSSASTTMVTIRLRFRARRRYLSSR